MKTSNKILTGLAAVIIIGLIVLIAVFRGFAGRVMKEAPAGTIISGSGHRVERSFDIRDFSGIDSVGGWKVTIQNGPDYDVRITADENIFEVLRVTRTGEGSLVKKPSVGLAMAMSTGPSLVTEISAVPSPLFSSTL